MTVFMGRAGRASEPLLEHDVVVLTRDVPSENVRAGDVGVILAIHAGSATVPPGYTLELTTVTGETAAIVNVPTDYVRPAAPTDIRHTRSTVKSV
jgi:hypothetical protein